MDNKIPRRAAPDDSSKKDPASAPKEFGQAEDRRSGSSSKGPSSDRAAVAMAGKGTLRNNTPGFSLAIDHLSTLTNPGRILKPEIPATIFFLTELYRTHTGTPHYFEVGLLVSKHFRDVLPRKVVDGDVTEWVRKTATRYACILEQLCGDNKRVDSVLKRLGKSRLLESLHP